MAASSRLADGYWAVREGRAICRFENSNFTPETLIYLPHHQPAMNLAHHMTYVTAMASTCGPQNGTAVLSAA